MKTAFITRSTLFSAPGGDTIQVLQTSRYLRKLGIDTDILLTSNPVNYSDYNLFHFINITRPSDILFHIKKSKKPFVVSPNLVDYSEYDKNCRHGFSGLVLRQFSGSKIEYLKTIARWVKGNDVIKSKSYFWRGQRKSIRDILQAANMVLPNSESEYKCLEEEYGISKEYALVPNGIDTSVFSPDLSKYKNDKLIICAARIEGLKNQLNLIKAINNTDFTLYLIGSPGPNQKKYYDLCRQIAGKNIHFKGHVSQQQLMEYYKIAKVHALPSWFETCGLSSLEAAAMGCNIIITRKGYTEDYFGTEAFYCDPENPESIYNTIVSASLADTPEKLQQRILNKYTWQNAASITAAAYLKTISACKN